MANPESPVPLSDEALWERIVRRPLSPNNQWLDFDILKGYDPVLLEILKKHRLIKPMKIRSSVPEIYLQQCWHTMAYNKDDDEITYKLDNFDFSIDLNLLRKLLKFPPPNLGPRTSYDPFPTDEPLITDIVNLGYTGELTKTSGFIRKNLAGVWYEAYGLLTQTLTSKYSGQDKATKNFLHLFHGFCYDRHIDYAQVIWNELKENVQKKNKPGAVPYIPFIRFLQVIVSVTLNKFPEIPSRDDSDAYMDISVKSMKTRKGAPDIPAMAFPLSMLLLADQTHPAVIAYKTKHYHPGAGVPVEQPPVIVSSQPSQI